MTEAYYNVTADGTGFPGILNYTNKLVDGWLAIAFLAMTWIVMVIVGMKSEWKPSAVISSASFVAFISAMMLSLIIEVNSILIFVFGVMTGIGVAWMWIENKAPGG